MGTPPAVQLPLALRSGADQRFALFVGAPGVVAQLLQLVPRPSATEGGGDAARVADAADASASAVYLSAGAGLGKTHLLLATCAHAEANGKRAAYLPLASMAGRLRDALPDIEGHAVLAIDGVEAIAGNRDDELALFDLHNRARDAGCALLYAARGMPGDLQLALPDLRSRLAQCTRLALSPLDDDGRRTALRLRAEARGLQMDDAALDWLLRRVGRDLAGLSALLERLDAASLAAQRRITVPFLGDLLGR